MIIKLYENLQEFASEEWVIRVWKLDRTIATATRRRLSNEPSLLIAVRRGNQAHFYYSWYVDEGQRHVRDRFA